MSSRALRRLQGDRNELEIVEGLSEDDSLSSRSHGGAIPKKTVAPNKNPFDLLNNDTHSESEVKEDDDLGSRSEVTERKPVEIKQKRKRKNRKRGNAGKPPPVRSSEDNLEDFDDEIERSVQEVNKILGEIPKELPESNSSTTTTTQKVTSRSSGILAIEHKNLNPENEMKKIFGSRVVAAASIAAHKKDRHTRHRAHVRSSHWLVVPKPAWPNPGRTGLSMKFIDSSKCGAQYFAFDHSESYRLVQNKFFEAVDSLNPDFIIQLLNEHPYHIDSMLQLSDICKMGEDLQMAAELIERTLFAMESAFHPLFNLAVETCRLDYRRQENRAFFIALFRHLNFVGSRACYRTAMEFCKLILSLDPEVDPLGIKLMIDFYAIRAQQYSWLITFYEEWEPTKNLSQLPNFAYSVALTYFHLSRDSAKGKEEYLAKADEFMQRALIMFPGVLLPLLDKCSIEPDSKVVTHSFFLDSQLNVPTALQILTSLYIGRSHHVWKEPEILPWLSRNVDVVLGKVEAGDPIIADCAQKRKIRYQGTPRNIYRHVIISDIKDATASLPPELSLTPILSYDPLPPVDSIDTYKRTDRSNPQINDPNAFRVFFRSLLPNFNPSDTDTGNTAQEGGGGGGGGGAAGTGQGDLRRSVTTLLDAMQDLLGNLHLPEVPHDADASGDSEEEDPAGWD